jgi:pimeloyl-ACP methyl ester carboxylesterase
VLKVCAAIILVLATLGFVTELIIERRETARFPPPGTFVDVPGGRRLHVICSGQGSPPVIFESSMFSSSMSIDRVRAIIKRRTRVCSYDRVGMAWSTAGPARISVGSLVSDLERILPAAGPPPYVLAPSSIGGLTAELFTRRHPEQVAGLVFVDAGQSALVDRFAPMFEWLRFRAGVIGACALPMAARFGLVRLLDPLELRGRGEARNIALLYRAAPMRTVCGILREAATSATEFRDAPPFPRDVPLIVLNHERPDKLLPPRLPVNLAAIDAEWGKLQREFSSRSTRGSFRVVLGSDHLIASSQPQAVADAVLEVLVEIDR